MRYAHLDSNNKVYCIHYSTNAIDPLPSNIIEIGDMDVAMGSAYQDGIFIAPVPASKKQITRLEFLRRFTAAERVTIRKSNDDYVKDYLALLDIAQDVVLDDPDTLIGTQYLEEIGLLAEGRATEILAISE